MKHISFYFLTCLILCLSLTACKTTRTSEKAVSESESVSAMESRLTFYRTIDSLSRKWSLSADSLLIIFSNPATAELPAAVPSGMKRCTETPADSARKENMRPKKLKVYGLHVTASSDKKSVSHTDLKDSVNTFTQSEKVKSVAKQSSSPNFVLKGFILIIIVACIIYGIYRCRRLW